MNNTLTLGANMLVPFGAIFAMAANADERLQALTTELDELVEQRDGIVTAADEADIDLTDEQVGEIEGLQKKIAAKQKQVDLRAQIASDHQSAGRRATPELRTALQSSGSVQAVKPRLNVRGGFDSFGQFAAAAAKYNPGNPDQRMLAAATTYSNEGNGSDGGFAVPQEFRNTIWQKVMSVDSLLSRCDQLITGSNNYTVPKDETAPWDTTNGVQVYWQGEGAAGTPSKVQLQSSTARLNKLFALVPVTEELLSDAPGLDSYLRAMAPRKMDAKINTALIRGNGVGQPLGILNAGSRIDVAIESGPQTTDTVIFPNIVKMWSRMYAPCRRNAVWIINQDVEPQLNSLAFLSTAASPVPAYMPANGLSASPYATLMGRPVVPVAAASTLGDLGDIMLVDFTQYMAVTKGTDIRTDVSIHLYFDQDVSTYRFVFRIAGQPWWGSTITPENGTNTLSWAVALAAR